MIRFLKALINNIDTLFGVPLRDWMDRYDGHEYEDWFRQTKRKEGQ